MEPKDIAGSLSGYSVIRSVAIPPNISSSQTKLSLVVKKNSTASCKTVKVTAYPKCVQMYAYVYICVSVYNDHGYACIYM